MKNNATYDLLVVQPKRIQLDLSPKWLVVHQDYSGVIATFAAYVDIETVRAFVSHFIKDDHGVDKVRIYNTVTESEEL